MTTPPAPGTFSGSRPIALITGAARRVGRAAALALATHGCDILFTYNTSTDEAKSLLAELSALGGGHHADRLDLADPAACDHWARRTLTDLPRLDILVHNASIYTATALADVSADDALEHYRINAVAPLLLSSRLAPLLAQSPLPARGSIVCMCDIHAMGRPRRNYAAYSMSKAALADLVPQLARELAPNVRVNGVAPGAVAFAESGTDADPEMQARYLSRVPLARVGTPEDAAEVVRWLALDAAYTTGQIIRVDGGRWIT